MARHPLVKFKRDHERNHYCYYAAILSVILLVQTPVFARPPLDVDVGLGHDDGNVNDRDVINTPTTWEATWLGAVLSLSFLVILVTLAAFCAGGGCCGEIQWFGRSRQDAPLSFSNPMTEQGATMMMPISQIDVRALELDPIVFEPLPTVHDLTPVGSKTQTDRGQSNVYNAAIPIIPFSTDDSSVYAHDWFEEPHSNFPRSNIEYVKIIGKGWFGQVIEAEAIDIVPFARKIRVIVKVLREDANGMEQMRFLDESRIYRDGDHGNILKLLGHSIEKLPFLLIMEHCPQGDLKSFLISNVIRAEMLYNQGTVAKMALDVAKGLEWLHSAGFVHPDLASRNCQVGSENRVVIGDYGLGTQNFKDDYHWSSNIAIPLRWTAPESLHCTASVIQILKVTESSNIWSLGVVIWEICEFGKLPYFELADDEVITRVIIDKSYYLGRPTLPCMAGKEELYNIMSSCWQAEIEDRPYLSTIIRQLEDLCKTFHHNSSPSKDEFESRWDQLGTRSGSEDEKRRKKNVSFVGLERSIRKLEFESSFEETEAMRNAENSNYVGSADVSQDMVADRSSNDNDDTEEEQWTKKIERGDISQKVLEKTQSVQDLMVLTHFEQGDMGELDSLVFVTKSPPSSSPSSMKESESLNSTLKKSSSEPAMDAMSVATSSHTLTPSSVCDSNVSPSSTLVPPELSVIPCTPGTTPNRTGIDINVITATPNPSVEINVVQATPNGTPATPSPHQNGTDAENKSDAHYSAAANRKLHFNFDTSPQKSRQRLTSTPLRSGSTPSPRISDFEGNENEEEMPVFDSSGHYLEGTFDVSPISRAASNTINSSNFEASTTGESSIFFGASDAHELGTYQGIKSQLHESNPKELPSDSEDEDTKIENTIAKHPKPAVPRRILFPNGFDETTGSSTASLLNTSNFESVEKDSSANSGSTSKVSETPSVDVSENDAFWEQQLKSLQVAAGNTRDLFHSGLNDAEDVNHTYDIADKRFVEDIEAAAEELGSLVLHDLEDTDQKGTVIKEARSAIDPDAGMSAKLAFENNSVSEESFAAESEMTSSSVDNESRIWDINNSIEIRKVKEDKLKEESSVTSAGFESDLEDMDEAVNTEFVPSKWNQTLVPSRPAIKSPEQQPRSSMKKSVSFEMKKTQLVYEYPPPPVVSDSEEEEKVRTPLATASLPLSSSSLDWELTQEELEDAEINHEDWDDDIMPKAGDPMDVYRISGFSDDNFQVRGSSEPFVFSPSTLGELRHTRDKLRLDLHRGEANFLDEESKTNPAKLDSGVGSSTNVSPFSNCDILTKRNKSSD